MRNCELVMSFVVLLAIAVHQFIWIHVPLIECHYKSCIQFQRPCFIFIHRKRCVPPLFNPFHLNRGLIDIGVYNECSAERIIISSCHRCAFGVQELSIRISTKQLMAV